MNIKYSLPLSELINPAVTSAQQLFNRKHLNVDFNLF